MSTLVLPWFALRTRSRHEKIVSASLQASGYDEFLALSTARHKWADRYKDLRLPLIPGYVFCRFHPDLDRIPILRTPGVVDIVRFGRQLAVVDDQEVESLRRAAQSDFDCQPWNGIEAGDAVLVCAGPLTGVRGSFVENKTGHRLVLSISLLQRSVAVEMPREWVQPVRKPAAVAPNRFSSQSRVA